MDNLQSMFESALVDSAARVFSDMLADKIEAQGLKLTSRERDRLLKRLQSDEAVDLRFRAWKWWDDAVIAVEWTDEDWALADHRVQRLLDGERIVELIARTTDDTAEVLLRTLRRTWKTVSRNENRERRGFETRLGARWGLGLDRLRMALSVAGECGEMAANSASQDPEFSSPVLLDVLAHSHARACQITEEILILLSSGFADGAMARWRTLHEIAVVTYVLGRHGEQMAQSFIDHEIVESMKAARDYRECSDRLGYEPMSDSEYDEIRDAYDGVVRQYGKAFKTQYGWAAEALGSQKPSFRDLELEAGVDHLRGHYRLASHNVHANPKGVFLKLGLMEESDVLLAGSSNVGLTDPGHGAAISLLQVTATLATMRPSLDALVHLRILTRLVDEVGDLFIEAQQELEGDLG